MFVLTESIHPRKERNLNVAYAVILPASAATSAGGKIGTFTDLPVQLWPRKWTLMLTLSTIKPVCFDILCNRMLC